MDDSTVTHQRILSVEDFSPLEKALNRAPWIALDTESNSYFVYRERVCLIQINVEGSLFIIDPLAFDGSQLDPIAPLRNHLTDPAKTVYLHGGEYDVAVMKREYGIAMNGVFDTQQAASFLGWPKTGYQTAVQNICGVHLAKAHSQYDWGKRPLDSAAVQYALDDVIYLPKVARDLQMAVADADLVQEVELANTAVMAAAPHAPNFNPAQALGFKGAKDLNLDDTRRLVALHRWRDTVARRQDFPPGRLIANQALIALARQDPADMPALRRTRLQGKIVRTLGQSLLDCLEDARCTPQALPVRPSRERPSAIYRQRETDLKRWRSEESKRREVPLQVVLPTRVLTRLAASGANALESIAELGSKRVSLYGDRLRKLCE